MNPTLIVLHFTDLSSNVTALTEENEEIQQQVVGKLLQCRRKFPSSYSYEYGLILLTLIFFHYLECLSVKRM